MTSTSTLFQGLQSCLEPTFLEPHVLMNKLSPPKSNSSQSMMIMLQNSKEEIEEENEENSLSFNELQNQHDNGDMAGGWSFIQALANPCQYPKKDDTPEDDVYVHPLVKPCALNTKSLEMCTENLGSETGSDISETIEEFSTLLLSEKETTNYHGTQRLKCREFTRKLKRVASFPPPLTSMSGNEGVQVRPHREGGRLVLKAVTITSCNTYFQAERSDGRLRLSLLKHDDDECSHEEEEEEDDDENQVNEHENDDEICEGNGSRKLAKDNIGVGEFSRPRRCKSSGSRSKGIPCWEPFWVAIS